MSATLDLPHTAMAGDITLAEAAELTWLEAELLDRHDYLAWLDLWADGARYIVAIDRAAEGYQDVLNVAYDDAGMREARVRRLRSGFSMSSAPPARTVRTVSRFVAKSAQTDMLTLRAAEQIVEYKFERTRVLAADVDYRIVRVAGQLKLAQKVVLLVNSDEALHCLGYLL